MLDKIAEQLLTLIERAVTKPRFLTRYRRLAQLPLEFSNSRKWWLVFITSLSIGTYVIPDMLSVTERQGRTLLSVSNDLRTVGAVVLFTAANVLVWPFVYWSQSIQKRSTEKLDPPARLRFRRYSTQESGAIFWWILVAAVLLGQLLLISASRSDRDVAWWDFAELHWPLATLQLSLLFYAIGVFLWRSFAFNLYLTRIWRQFGCPPRRYSGRDIYSITTENYIQLALPFLLAVLVVLVSWSLQPAGGSLGNFSLRPFTAFTLVMPIAYPAVLTVMFVAPIIFQRSMLVRSRDAQITNWNKYLDDGLACADGDRNTGSAIADAYRMRVILKEAYPAWPVPSETVRAVGAVVAIALPLLLNAGRILLT